MEQWCMVDQWLYCSPGPRSEHDIVVPSDDQPQSLYVSAYCPDVEGDEEALQCWTNLPIVDKEEGSEWTAIEVGPWHPRADGHFASQLIPLDTELLMKRLREGKVCKYALTWRTVNRRKRAIRWLHNSDEDAIISFHSPPSHRTSRQLIESLEIVDHTVQEERDADLIVSAQLDQNAGSTRILSCKRCISSGATWERTKSTWHTSRSFSQFDQISPVHRASLIILAFADLDRVVIVLPICRKASTVNLIRKDDNLTAEHQGQRELWNGKGQIVVAVGPISHLHDLISRCVRIVTATSYMSPSDQWHNSPLLSYQNFGFCSWEALGAGRERPTLTVMTRVLERIEKRSPGAITSLLIDDGWQTIVDTEGHRRLKAFDLEPSLLEDAVERDDSNLKCYIDQLRDTFPSIQYYGVWMTLAGYWDALDEQSFAERYGPLSVLTCNNLFTGGFERTWYMPNPSLLDAYYDNYFAFLKNAGIDFVKVDDQADWEWIQGISVESGEQEEADPIKFYDKAWNAMISAAKKHFGPLCVINCMAFGHRCITGQILPSQDSQVFRNSDDTFPNVPESHIWHIYHNALNACLSGAIPNLIPDADMITTYMPAQEGDEDQDWADFHAAFRACFSNSTIWISDSADLETEGGDELLKRLLAPAKDVNRDTSLGRLHAVQVGTRGNIRCSRPLIKSTFDDLTSDSVGPALKMSHGWTLNDGTVVCAVLSTWNVRLAASSIDWITSTDVAHSLRNNSTKADSFFIFDTTSKSASLISAPCISSSFSALVEQPLLPFALKSSQYRIFLITSALASNSHKQLRVACLGLLDKYAGLTAVTSTTTSNSEATVSSTLSRAGKCAFLIYGIDIRDLNKWHARVDGDKVHKDHTTIEQVDECVLFNVDMMSHLETSLRSINTDADWHVDLVDDH